MPMDNKNHIWSIVAQCCLAIIGTFLTILATNTDSNPKNDYDITIWIIMIGFMVASIIAINVYNRHKTEQVELDNKFYEMTTIMTDRIELLSKTIDMQFSNLETRQNAMLAAQHVTMRTTLIHYAEKYIDRGWLTPEEFRAWDEMYVEYDSLGFNGFMKTYLVKLQELPWKTL